METLSKWLCMGSANSSLILISGLCSGPVGSVRNMAPTCCMLVTLEAAKAVVFTVRCGVLPSLSRAQTKTRKEGRYHDVEKVQVRKNKHNINFAPPLFSVAGNKVYVGKLEVRDAAEKVQVSTNKDTESSSHLLSGRL